MINLQKSVLSDEHKRLLIENDWIYYGKPGIPNRCGRWTVHDEYWIRHLHELEPKCSGNPDKSMFVELQVFARRTFPREPGLGVQLVLCGGKRDKRWVNLMVYGMTNGIDLEELKSQTAQLVAAWEAMNKAC